MPKDKKRPTLFDLSREPFQPEDREGHIAEMLTGLDRPAALVGCAMLDANLRLAIGSRMLMWDEKAEAILFYNIEAPLASFSAKIKVGRALAIYGPKTYNWLNIVRNIRNAFAHSVRPVTFGHRLISTECNRLPEMELERETRPDDLHPMRERYVAVCVNVSIKLQEYVEANQGTKVRLFMP